MVVDDGRGRRFVTADGLPPPRVAARSALAVIRDPCAYGVELFVSSAAASMNVIFVIHYRT
jgi:hypothetical protein